MTPRKTAMSAEMAANVRPLPLSLPSHHVSSSTNCSFIHVFPLNFHLIINNIFTPHIPLSPTTSLSLPSIICCHCIHSYYHSRHPPCPCILPSLFYHHSLLPCLISHPPSSLRQLYPSISHLVNNIDAMNIW